MFIFAHIFTHSLLIILPCISDLFLVSPSSVGNTFFRILPLWEGLLGTNFGGFYVLENVFILSSSLKDNLLKIHFWFGNYFLSSMATLHCILVSSIAVEKYSVNQIGIPLESLIFSPAAFNIFVFSILKF